MSDSAASKDPSSTGLDPVVGGDALSGMALLGKTAVSLLVVVALILLLTWLVRRFNLHQGRAGQHLHVVGSVAVGQREKVVLVEVDKTWLVLGVGGGQVTRLHELPAQTTAVDRTPPPGGANSFSNKLAQSLVRRAGRNTEKPEESSDGTRP